ncbi:minor capsid protein [Brevirhabdus pacifica]|uniref:minor capsid protein n=1 Tax=Brevirhabdus pacifica TaxID=1267768 RepID=UPI0012FE16CB|nr:minor capsid protein [Brevirhabdus pacifica]
MNDDIADAQIAHSIGLQRLSTATVRKIVARLRRSEGRILARLARDDLSALSRARQERLLKDLEAILETVKADTLGRLTIDLEALAEYEVEYQLDLFENVAPVRLDFVRPPSSQIVAVVNSRPFQGRFLREWFDEIETGAYRRLRNTIRGGIVEGRTTDQMIREIRGTAAQGYKDGILNRTRRDVEVVVRTAVAHTAQAARTDLYARNSALIKAVQWTSTLDGRTSAICRARDNKVFPVDSGPRPPAHPSCRSSVVPVLKSWREMGLKGLPESTRASMNGQVPADQTYSTWLRKQSVAFQNEVLGVKKATLFRRGSVDLDRFVDRAGNELTLDELRKRESEAWTKAGLNS